MEKFFILERVRIADRDGLFAVLYVDEVEGWAKLARLDGVGMLTHVPLAGIRRADEDESAEGAA